MNDKDWLAWLVDLLSLLVSGQLTHFVARSEHCQCKLLCDVGLHLVHKEGGFHVIFVDVIVGVVIVVAIIGVVVFVTIIGIVVVGGGVPSIIKLSFVIIESEAGYTAFPTGQGYLSSFKLPSSKCHSVIPRPHCATRKYLIQWFKPGMRSSSFILGLLATCHGSSLCFIGLPVKSAIVAGWASKGYGMIHEDGDNDAISGNDDERATNNVVEEEDGEWIRFLGGNSSSGTKKYLGSNSNDGGNTRDGVKIAGEAIGSGDEILLAALRGQETLHNQCLGSHGGDCGEASGYELMKARMQGGDVEVDPREISLRDGAIVRVSDEPHLEQDIDLEIHAEIDKCIAYADALRDRGIDARRIEGVAILSFVKAIEEVQREQGHRIVRVESAVISLTERIAELERDNRRLRGTASVRTKMPNTRSGASMTHEEVEELVTRRARTEEMEMGETEEMEMEEMEEMEMEGMEKMEMEIEMGIMKEVYCLRNEIHKMETELWNLIVKGNELTAYTQRFQELILLCTRMVPDEEDRVERFIGRGIGLLLQGVLRIKGGWKVNLRDNLWTANARSEGKIILVRQNVAELLRLRIRKKGVCWAITYCNKCRAAIAPNTQRAPVGNQQGIICYECGRPGHFRKDYPKLMNQNRGNQTRNKNGNKTGNLGL
ncbi:putative reverse transcriptase domain-containing protein [Tanacetum coccineum]